MKNNRIIAFFGCDTQTGTTMISLAAAEYLARCGWNVIHISAGLEPGKVYVPEEGTGSVSDLFRNFEEEELSEKELEDAMTECRGVRILPGVRSRQMGSLYTPGTLAEICRIAAATSDYVIIDARTEEEFAAGHIENAILIPEYEIAERAEEELPDKDALILVYCRSGRRSKIASEELVALGYTNVKEFGGIIDWPYEITMD